MTYGFLKIRHLIIGVLTLSPLITDSQIITFEDPSFKAALLLANEENGYAKDEFENSIIIDQNGNGEIEVSEVLPIYELFVLNSFNVSSLAGIEFFENITVLSCEYNDLTNVDVSMLENLRSLALDHNQLSSLDVSMLNNLTHLSVSNNQLATLNFNTQLLNLDCSNNNLSTIDLTQSTLLESFNGSHNVISQLDLSNNGALNSLDCSHNNLVELNLLNSAALTILNCNDNSLTDLSVTGLPLTHLDCSTNLLTNLDLVGVGPSELTLTIFIICDNNLLTSIDVTNTTSDKVRLFCNNSQSLNSIFVKNGHLFDDVFNPLVPPSPSVFFSNTPNLQLICADEFNFDYLEAKLLDYGQTGVTLTSECTLNLADPGISEVSHYPNPIKDTFIINCSSNYESFSLYNMMGQFIIGSPFEPMTPIPLDFLSAGQYIMTLHSKTIEQQIRIVKQ